MTRIPDLIPLHDSRPGLRTLLGVEIREAKASEAQAGPDATLDFIASTNELNRAFDLGFKPLPWGNKGYVPSTMQPAGESAPPGEPKPTKQPPKAQPDVFSRLAAAFL